jgi:hypothetical protein
VLGTLPRHDAGGRLIETPAAIDALISVRKGMVKQGIPPENIDAMVRRSFPTKIEIDGDDQ